MRLHDRLLVFSISLATSFAMLILFVGYLEGIVVSIFFLTASVVAASRADLKELSSARWTFAGLIAVVTALLVGIYPYLPQLYNSPFIFLVVLDSVLLIAY